MNKLSIIIPFLNEGNEILNTVESIRRNGGENVDIILINDCSEDHYDYESVALNFHTQYIRNEKRLGVARSRDLGVERCLTSYFLLLDGHMRFYDSMWVQQIVSELSLDERQLLCCQTKVLHQENGVVSETQNGKKVFGAYIDWVEAKGALTAKWLFQEYDMNNNTECIPCVLGAAYAASKKYWQYLKGLTGLLYYGSDEAYISMKVWLEGGKCKLLKDIVIGHIYRNTFPYPLENMYTIYNKMLIAELLLPSEFKRNVFAKLRDIYSTAFDEAYRLLIENRLILRELKAYYRQIFINDFDLIVRLNITR